MEERPLVSLVLLSWNRKDDVLESLRRIKQSSWPRLEIVVADNASTDGTPEAVRAHHPDVALIEIGKNMGIGAWNVGFRRSTGSFVVLLDDDSFPAAKAVERMVNKFRDDPKLGVVAFDVRNYYSYDDVAEDGPEEDSATTEDYLMGFNGAGVGMRREVFEQAGCFPEEFFLYWNEQDTAIRILDAGWKIKFHADVVAYHKYSPANRASWRAPFYYCRNAFWLVWKNYPLADALRRTVRLGRLVAYHSVEQKTWVYVKAALSAISGVFMIARLRKPVRPEVAKTFRAPLELSFTFYR